MVAGRLSRLKSGVQGHPAQYCSAQDNSSVTRALAAIAGTIRVEVVHRRKSMERSERALVHPVSRR